MAQDFLLAGNTMLTVSFVDTDHLLVTFGLSVIIQNALLVLFTHDSRRLYAGPIEMASWKFTRRISRSACCR